VAETRKSLGQIYPSGGVLTPLYRVPTDKSAVASSLVICNQSKTRGTFRVSIAVDDSADSSKQYDFYDVQIDGNRTYIATIGMTLDSGDVVRFQSSNGRMSAKLYGVEIS